MKDSAFAFDEQARSFVDREFAFFVLRYGKDGWRTRLAQQGSLVARIEVGGVFVLAILLSALLWFARNLIRVPLLPAIWLDRKLRGQKPPPPQPERPSVTYHGETDTAFDTGCMLDLRPVKRQTLSALLCNYNHGRYIERAISSIVGQSRKPDEYLILDDGSTDNSLDIIRRYERQYPFIKVVRKERNEGYLSAVRQLTDMARGDWIHRGASDDYMQPGFIEHSMRLAERWPDAGVVSGMMLNGEEEEEPHLLIGMSGFETGYVTPEAYLHDYLEVAEAMCVLVPSSLYRLSAVKEMGGWREELGIGDSSFVLQAAALKYGMCYLKLPCYSWFYRKKGWTHSESEQWLRTLQTCQAYYQLMRSPQFAPLFGDKFPKLWLAGFAKQFADTWPIDVLDRIVGRIGGPGAAARPATAA